MYNIKNIFSALAVIALTISALTGCSISDGGGYTREELGNLAKLEIYEADSDTLIRAIEDEETLYRFNQVFQVSQVSGDDSDSEDAYIEWESAPEDYGMGTEEPKELLKDARKTYDIVIYKHPVAKFGDKEPVKFLTMTLYENTDIVRIVVADESIKIFSLPEEFLTFYYEMSEEEREFCVPLLKKQ